MDYEFRDQAAAELEAAVDYYNGQKPGLGREFLDEVDRSLDYIRSFPEAAAPISARSRRHRLHRFPYGLIYQVMAYQIRILAVMHLSRRPDYWGDREQ